MLSASDFIIDFLTQDEEDAIRLLQQLILTKTEETKRRVIQILAKHITISYYLGAERAINQLKLQVQPTSIGVQGLDTVINELTPILEDTFGFLAKDLTDVIEKGIKNNMSYWQIKQQLEEKLRIFGNRITFQRAGKYREVVKVSPTGKLRLIRKKIRRNITISTEKYADMLARTATKKAYALGHIEAYKAGGIRKWRYTAVADERTRPHHLALHGKVFEVGSQEEQLALKVMGEPNCRCRPVPFFDNPQFDTPDYVYEQEKKEWARKALDELKDKRSKKARYLRRLAGIKTPSIPVERRLEEHIRKAWEATEKDGYERAIGVVGDRIITCRGRKKDVGRRWISFLKETRDKDFKFYHTHPSWDSPLSPEDIWNFLKLENCKEMVAITKKHKYRVVKTDDTIHLKYVSAQEFREEFYQKAEKYYTKFLAYGLEKEEAWRKALITVGKEYSKQFKFKYIVEERK